MSLNANRVKSSATSGAEARNLKTMRGRQTKADLHVLIIERSTASRIAISGRSFPKILRTGKIAPRGNTLLAENRDEYSGRTTVPRTFLRRLHISGQAISRGADFNDQSPELVVAAAHKNMSLGCRNISAVETYWRGDAPCPLILIPGHGTLSPIVSCLSLGTFPPLSLRSRKHETDHRAAPTGSEKGINEACIAHRSNYLSNPIYPSRRVLASRLPPLVSA